MSEFNSSPAQLDMQRSASLQRRVRLRAVTGFLLTSLLLGGLTACLLYASHSRQLDREMQFETQLLSAALGGEIRRQNNVAAQITSRTRIRQELERYNRGEISQLQLALYSRPKLQDVMRLSPDVLGVTRLDRQNRPAVSLGLPIPEPAWPRDYAQNKIMHFVPRDQASQPYLLISAPITNPAGRRSGTDLVAFDYRRMQEILQRFANRHPVKLHLRLATMHGDTLKTFMSAGPLRVTLHPEALTGEIKLASHDAAQKMFHGGQFADGADLMVRQKVPGSNWVLLLFGRSDNLYSLARWQAFYTALAVLMLALAGVLLTNRLIKPLTRQINRETKTIAELLQDQKVLLDKVLAKEQQLQAFLDNTPAIISLKDRQGRYQLVNNSFEKFVQLPREDILGYSDRDLFTLQTATGRELIDRHIMESGQIMEWDERVRNNHETRDFLSLNFPIEDESGGVSAVCAISTDITERKHAEFKLRLSSTVFENIGEGIVITDTNGIIQEVNPAFCEIIGYSSDELLGKTPKTWKSDRHDQLFYQELWWALLDQGEWRGEVWNKRKDGRVVPELVTISSTRNGNGDIQNFVAMYHDISELKQSELQLKFMAHHDALTELPNRVLFNARLEHALERCRRSHKQAGIIFMDLDQFKHVNDSLGHRAGDLLLQEVAKLLKSVVRSDDTVARIGGDEFTILLEDINDTDVVIRVVEKVLHSFAREFLLEGRSIRITPSMGIAVFPDDGSDANTLMRNADSAMYHAKSDGRNTYQFYTNELTAHAFERMLLESNLRKGLENEQFMLHYQPQVDLASGKVVGMEALLRWQHPDMGMVPPDKFIPIAEEGDLIIQLGEWVIRSACRQARTWLDQGLDFGRIAVNISGKQISRGTLPELLAKVLEEYRLSPCYLELEVTESCIIDEAESAIEMLHTLRDMGFKLAVDDFGTGYSSLTYLKKLPVHTLKIDRSFVMDIPQDRHDVAISRAVIALGKSLELELVAEGVETREQLEFLLHEGCQCGQGYLYSRPVDHAEMERLLSKGEPYLTRAKAS